MSTTPVISRITEPMLRVYGDDFRQEIANTLALVEELARNIFGPDEDQDLTVGETHAYLLCENAKLDEALPPEDVPMARLRLCRAVSVLSISFGVDMPPELLTLDRNVYDTIQSMAIIERNGKQLEQLAAARKKVDENILQSATNAVSAVGVKVDGSGNLIVETDDPDNKFIEASANAVSQVQH